MLSTINETHFNRETKWLSVKTKIVVLKTFMLIEAILLGTLTVTSYRAVPEQTKPECTGRHHCETSIGENVSELGVAVSQDLLESGAVHYGDALYIDGVGYRLVFDCMARRHKNAVDVFVYTPAEERRFGVRHLKVYIIREKQKSPEEER